ncbi:MAG TPA: hypothetical protein ENN41_06325, partial [Sediminispirochaeta sp.]|nr:hypothetical protein [Sediminispirochaeta sp.]
TAEVITEDGWFRTGDLGYMDKDGYLYIRGRLKNMILGPSGENIYPEAIEALINEYDFVLDSLVLEQQGKLVARVRLDYQALTEHVRDLAESAGDLSKQVGDYLNTLKKNVNKRLNVFNRVSVIVEEEKDFEKTPTKKIKRYLYTHLGNKDKIEEKEQQKRKDDQRYAAPKAEVLQEETEKKATRNRRKKDTRDETEGK